MKIVSVGYSAKPKRRLNRYLTHEGATNVIRVSKQEVKTCIECGETKPSRDFHKRVASSDGLKPRCRVCECARVRIQRAVNPERTKELKRKWRAANRERDRKKRRAYYAANKEAINKRKREWRAGRRETERRQAREYRAANIERSRESTRKWQKAHPEKVKESLYAWRKKNPEAIYAINRRWYETHEDRARKKALNWAANNPQKVRENGNRRRARKKGSDVGNVPRNINEMLLKLQNGICACGCGADLRITGFHQDHIMPLKLGGGHTRQNLQLLTPFCNGSKKDLHPDAWRDRLERQRAIVGAQRR